MSLVSFINFPLSTFVNISVLVKYDFMLISGVYPICRNYTNYIQIVLNMYNAGKWQKQTPIYLSAFPLTSLPNVFSLRSILIHPLPGTRLYTHN